MNNQTINLESNQIIYVSVNPTNFIADVKQFNGVDILKSSVIFSNTYGFCTLKNNIIKKLNPYLTVFAVKFRRDKESYYEIGLYDHHKNVIIDFQVKSFAKDLLGLKKDYRKMALTIIANHLNLENPDSFAARNIISAQLRVID